MRLEDDPTVKTLPSERMRKILADKVLKANLKIAAKSIKGA